ncbi:KIP1-like protein [Cynara cardunculus var. scolymus]|uniref:KIP1-like protein n=1 Tax=Cynara cardunculus var. scolymus TaxID=59895 RepID=A0A103XSR6_CYNCS|nr:KIP1-like protein [Cynara cardunculus var. scolymus]
MENSSTEYGSSSSHLWWLDNSHNRCHQSQWLQFTLSEFEKKVKKMLSLIEEDGDSFAERAEDSLEQKVELVKRNNDNREAINDLRAYIRKLLVQNIELKSKLAQTKGDIKRNESQLSRAEDVILKEILP